MAEPKTPTVKLMPIPLPWTISGQGTRLGMVEFVKKTRSQPENSDQGQIESAKLHILAEINALPDEFNGVQVLAEGHGLDSRRHSMITVIGLKLIS